MTEAQRKRLNAYNREWRMSDGNSRRIYDRMQEERHRRIAAGGKTPEDVQIGINLYRSREAMGVSARELADKAGVTYNTVYNVERGLVTPKIETLSQIRAALKSIALERINVLAKIAKGEDL